jgi:hypothetical protein
MAVIEIAKIQVRRGQENQTGVPPLAGGEFAWAADTENLYIGLKREDGGSRDANIRVLTENDLRNFFVAGSGQYITGVYTYRSGTEITVFNSGTSIYTEYSPGTEVLRTLQDKLDEYVSVKDFGVLGDGGINSQDELFQLAIDRLYSSTATEYATSGPSGKVLHIPSGEYAITATIYLPKNAHLIGEGIDKTILVLKSDGEHVFQTIDVDEYRNNPSAYPPAGVFTNTNINAMSTPYIPSNIHIENMTIRFETTAETTLTGGLSLLSLDCAENALIRRVKFEGNFNETKIADSNYSAIDLRGYAEEKTTRNVVIDDCEFKNLHSGITSNYDVTNIAIQNSFFTKLFNGIAFNRNLDTVVASTGPRFVRVENNKFLDVMEDAFYVGANNSTTGTNHTSIGNQYINVGNRGQGETYSTGTSIITYLTKGNTSINDYFDRQHWQDVNGGFETFNPLISGRAILTRTEISNDTIPSNGAATIMRLPITGYQQYLTIKYSCYVDLGSSSSIDRMGNVQFYIKAGQDPEVLVSDEYNYSFTDGALYWGATVNADYKFIEVTIYNPAVVDGGAGYPISIGFQPHLIL